MINKNKSLNVVIPLGGIGKRFDDFGYTRPKPLIRALGESIIFKVIKSLKIEKKDKVYIIYNSFLDRYNFQKHFIKYKNINLIRLEQNTRGPVETVCNLKSFLDEEKLDNPLLICDGDTFYKKNIINELRNTKHSTIVYSKTNKKDPIYSYIKFNKKKEITKIREKKRISDNFSTGAYYFKSTNLFLNESKKIFQNNKKAYISNIYDALIKRKEIIKGLHIKKKDFHILGTPKELFDFCIKEKIQKKKICFDLEALLEENYSFPNYTNIDYLNTLKKQGHFIIIQAQKNLNFKKKQLIIKTLKKFQISFNSLLFSKPKADFIVDYKSVNPVNDLDFELGYYDEKKSLSRVRNKITIGENITYKTSFEKKINLESKYLKSIPKEIKKFFPKIYSTNEKGYFMETINGITFQKLLELDLLEIDHIKKMLEALEFIHSKKLKNNTSDTDIYYSNYLSKFKKRLKSLSISQRKKNHKLFDNLINFFKIYKKKQLAKLNLIHGDTVFSNIFLVDNKIKFIDPRGGQDEEFSIYGDVHYDYAKIYQSLLGYEFLLNNKKSPSKMNKLRNYFEEYMEQKQIDLGIIKKITSSLFISLIPLHENINSQKILKFAKKINSQ